VINGASGGQQLRGMDPGAVVSGYERVR